MKKYINIDGILDVPTGTISNIYGEGNNKQLSKTNVYDLRSKERWGNTEVELTGGINETTAWELDTTVLTTSYDNNFITVQYDDPPAINRTLGALISIGMDTYRQNGKIVVVTAMHGCWFNIVGYADEYDYTISETHTMINTGHIKRGEDAAITPFISNVIKARFVYNMIEDAWLLVSYERKSDDTGHYQIDEKIALGIFVGYDNKVCIEEEQPKGVALEAGEIDDIIMVKHYGICTAKTNGHPTISAGDVLCVADNGMVKVYSASSGAIGYAIENESNGFVRMRLK